MKSEKLQGWVVYDDSCGFCRAWLRFWESTVRRRGFAIVPLRLVPAERRAGIATEEWFDDLRLMFVDGTQVAGADVYRHLLRCIWWARPIYLLAVAPLVRYLFDRGYRMFADNRYRFSRSCGLQPTMPNRKPAQPRTFPKYRKSARLICLECSFRRVPVAQLDRASASEAEG